MSSASSSGQANPRKDRAPTPRGSVTSELEGVNKRKLASEAAEAAVASRAPPAGDGSTAKQCKVWGQSAINTFY